MTPINEIRRGKQTDQQTVSGYIEHVVMLPCPFCGGEADDLGGDYYSCSNDICAAISVDCTSSQWNTRAT